MRNYDQTTPNEPQPILGRQGRAVGLDIHPDSFATAILHGRDPLSARVLHGVTRQPLAALAAWAERHTTPADVLLIEASAKSYLANDKLNAANIARIYLSGLAVKVWQPDAETRARRELLSTYQRCVKESDPRRAPAFFRAHGRRFDEVNAVRAGLAPERPVHKTNESRMEISARALQDSQHPA